MSYEQEPVSGVQRVSPSVGQQILKQRLQQLHNVHADQDNGVKRSSDTRPNWEKALDSPHAVQRFSCYMIFVDAVNHLSLDKLQSEMTCEANLMNTEHDIQEELVNMSQLFSYLKGHASSDGAAFGQNTVFPSIGGLPHDGEYNPNAFNGLGRFDSSANSGYGFGNSSSDFDKEYVGKDYAEVVQKFESSFRRLFYADQSTDTLTFDQASKIDNPNMFPTGKAFDLKSYWSTLNGQYSKFNLDGHNVFATQPGQHVSLIQQYCYYKAQEATFVDSKAHVNSANGDITKLVNFNIEDTNCDPLIKSLMGIVTDFNKSIEVTRGGSYKPQFATTTETGTDLILNNELYTHTGGSASASGKEMGLYGYFSYAAFNYFWLKNPTATKSFPEGLNPVINGAPWNKWVAANEAGTSLSDSVTSWDTDVSGNEKNVGQSVGEGSVSIQSVTTNEGQDVNIVQTGLTGKKEADSTMLQNQKT